MKGSDMTCMGMGIGERYPTGCGHDASISVAKMLRC